MRPCSSTVVLLRGSEIVGETQPIYRRARRGFRGGHIGDCILPGMDCRKAREHVAVGFSGESAKDIAVEELVAKLALRIELPGEGYKVRQPLVPRSQLRGRQGEQLSPMWSRIEGSQLSFD